MPDLPSDSSQQSAHDPTCDPRFSNRDPASVKAIAQRQKIRVLHFATGGFSGVTMMVLDLAQALQSDHLDNRVVLRRKKDTQMRFARYLEHQNPIILPKIELVSGGLHLCTIYELYQICREYQPDILVAHGFPEHLLGRWCGILLQKMGLSIRLFEVEHASKERYTPWRLWQTRFLSHHTKMAIGVSQAVAAVLKKQDLSCQIGTICNGISVQKFFCTTPLINRPKDVIMVARFSKGKNHALLLNALKILKNQGINAKLTLIGGGSQRHQNKIIEQAKTLNLTDQIDFLGHSEDVASHLFAHKIFVLATYYEGLSLSVIEAMMAGCVVMGSDVAGVAELIDHSKDGFLFSNQNAQTLAKNLICVLNNPQNYQAMANLAQQKAKNQYSIQTMAQNYQKILLK